jgi:hypothetical protein
VNRTWCFNTVSIKGRHWTQSWDGSTHLSPSQLTSLISMLNLPSHILVDFSNCRFAKASLPTFRLNVWITLLRCGAIQHMQLASLNNTRFIELWRLNDGTLWLQTLLIRYSLLNDRHQWCMVARNADNPHCIRFSNEICHSTIMLHYGVRHKD